MPACAGEGSALWKPSIVGLLGPMFGLISAQSGRGRHLVTTAGPSWGGVVERSVRAHGARQGLSVRYPPSLP